MKNELRKYYKNRRKELSNVEKTLQSQQITRRILDKYLNHNQVFHVFLPIARLNEINTHFLIDELWKHKKTVIVPKMNGDQLQHGIYTAQTPLETNAWGISEPRNLEPFPLQDIDIVIVPLLVCDMSGNRIGYGKGFYDGFLKECSPKINKVGINYFSPIAQKIATYPHDIALDSLITPNAIFEFTDSTM